MNSLHFYVLYKKPKSLNQLSVPFLRFFLVVVLAMLPVLSHAQFWKKKKKEAPKTEQKSESSTGTTEGGEEAVGEDGPMLEPDLFTATDSVEDDKKKKKPKKVYMGKKYKKGYTKSGRSRKKTVEQFGYLKKHEEPKEYLLEKYYYDVKKKKLFKGAQLPKDKFKILHGPYKKLVNGIVVEEGYFNVGAKHGRWEKYHINGTLLAKDYFDNGLPRDAEVSFYDAGRTKLKQVIPWEYGEKTGQYYEFHENGLLSWQGWYEKGKRVGVWTEYYDFRNRRHFQYQYPESCYDEQFEPYVIREYDRNGKIVFELKEPGQRRQPVRARQ